MSNGEDLLDKIKTLKDDTDSKMKSYERNICEGIKLIVMNCKDELGLYVPEEDNECMLCCDNFPFVMNACTSEKCTYAICLDCMSKCKDKCPNCRSSFKK